MLSCTEKKQENKPVKKNFFGGVVVRGLVSLAFFSILLSDNCKGFAVAVPLEKNHKLTGLFLNSWFQGELPDLRN